MGRAFKRRKSEHIAPLSEVAGQYLQVLLQKVSLYRDKQGVVVLDVEFDGNTEAIWSSAGRREVFERYDAQLEDGAVVQQQINEIIDIPSSRANFKGAKFPFRYANGGALPVMRHRGHSYYCLFYREIHPIGWNIANGGSDSIHELIDPLQTMEREFYEEVIVVDPARRTRFSGGQTSAGLSSTLSTALRLAGRRFPHIKDIEKFSTRDCAMQWLDGPDRLLVRPADGPERQCSRIYVNVAAADCSIEVDRLVYMDLDDDAVVVHGETVEGELLNSIVGLFEVGKLKDAVKRQPWGSRLLQPDIVFHDAKRCDAKFESVLDKHFAHVKTFLGKSEIKRYQDARAAGRAFDLCPVAEGLLRREAKEPDATGRSPTTRQSDAGSGGRFNIFLAHHHEDARKIFEFLSGIGFEVFYYPETHNTTSAMEEINDAIDSANTLVVYLNARADYDQPYVKFECLRYVDDKVNRRRSPLYIYTIAPGMGLNDIPGPLGPSSFVIRDPTLEECLERLASELRGRGK